MVYRPTVRYDDRFKEYVDEIFKATSLDRNQIIRLALFAAPFSPLFQHQIKKHMTSTLPQASWEVTEHGLWMEQTFLKRGEERDVNGESKEVFTERPGGSATARHRSTERHNGEIYQKRVYKQSGGVTIKIG
ncbi:hypothetical protein BKP35_18180 [Anaerobacillus arseniciselenatis]|uniref:Uncharacterized protein n=1 Tax=Anaerobacillus arseniciselenatis TaxID=85682 RepID=A0A1S2L5J4_9BACI|nr:hypothetical protein [Anaerobacillus arseniciselenatis]OIJ07616.1 hypothetical protein BKP35_18180 [Anaerobacillus arseniciselenatis]